MPSKSKKMQATANLQSRSVGFLRPTMASQRRSINVKPESSSKVGTGHRKRGNKSFKSKYPEESVLHSSERNVKSAVELYKSTTSESSCSRSLEEKFSSVPSTLPTSERTALEDAKRMCADLQKQINELKMNQENLNRSLVRPGSQQSHMKQSGNLTADKVADANTPMSATDLHPTATKPVHPNSVIRVNVQKNAAPLFDTSNQQNELPNVQVYNSTFRKRSTSESMIKKLHTERDKYKHKVLKLQTELKLVKRGKDKVLKSPELSSSDITYYNTNMIGEGHIATVYSGTFNGKQVAVKKISKLGMLTPSDYSYLSAEAGLLIHLHHRNIVKIFGVCLSPMEPLIVMELVQGKTLLTLLDGAGGRLTPGQYFSISRDVAIGLAYLHNQRLPVLHLNLRPCNVLIDAFNRAKVADFGFSKIRISAGLSHHSALAYLAPELIKYPVQLTGKIDVYAYAVLLWQCHTCSDPANSFSTSEILDMLQKNERLPLGPELPQAFHDLIAKCWAASPIQRPTFKEIILELETMALPEDWNDNLRLMGIARMDTSDMGSSHDTTSLSSQMTDSYKHISHTTSSSNLAQPTVPHRSAAVDPPQNTYSSHISENPQPTETDQPEVPDPAPCSEVRYVSKSLQEQISRPEIVNDATTRSTALKDVDQLRPHVPYIARHGEQRKVARRYVSPIKYSKFDDKFHDFVSRACEAESVSKADARRSGGLGKARQRAPSYSSDPIRVYSLSTPSESTDKSSGSAATALYKPQLLRSGKEERYAVGLGDDPLRMELRRSNEVLSNAKRLLRNSPLKQQPGHGGYRAGSADIAYHDRGSSTRFPNKSKSEPSRYRRSYDRNDDLIPRGVGGQHSPRSDDVSSDSFVPLPPRIGAHRQLSLRDKAPTKSGDLDRLRLVGSSSESPETSDHCDKFPCKGNQRDGPPKTDGQNEDKIESFLRSTADQLTDVSNVLHSAADAKRYVATEAL